MSTEIHQHGKNSLLQLAQLNVFQSPFLSPVQMLLPVHDQSLYHAGLSKLMLAAIARVSCAWIWNVLVVCAGRSGLRSASH